MQRYPLRFRSILKERVWGGRALETVLGRRLPPGIRVGEAWEIVDRPPDTSVADNGPLAGRTLHELCAGYGRDLLGQNAADPERFPLIVKLLDPNDRLSVQVHPTARYVERHPEAEATKNEMWFVLHADPGARIVQGLKEGVTVEELRAGLARGKLEPLLRFAPVEAGEFYYIPSGLVHALLPGSLMVEIQQNSDTTFRLHDWGRPGLDGKPRRLHVTEAVETVETFLAEPGVGEHEELGRAQLADGVERAGGLACPAFRVEALQVPPGTARIALDSSSFTVLVTVRGRLTVACLGTEVSATDLTAGDSVLVPAGVEALQMGTTDGAFVLTTSLPRPSEARG
jgi:mannose-6-phosphate isomerase